MTNKQKATLLRELRKMVELDLKDTYGETLALKALETLEALYEQELLEDYE